MTVTTLTTEFGGRTLTIETGKLARLAGGSVTVQYGDTVLLGTANRADPRPGLDFFPLTIDFEERMYAAGKIPGGFIKREARPSEAAILAARLTDRPIRPLFPKGYKDDVQCVLTVLSTDSAGTPLSDTDTVDITVDPLNDAPVNTVPGAQTVNEDTPLAFSGGALISVTDVDGNLASTQLSVTNGDLNVALSGSATISAGANGSSALTISGSQTDINATLASLTYQGDSNFNGNDTLTVLDWLEGSYPNFFFLVDLERIEEFGERYQAIRSRDDYERFVALFGVRRTNQGFWEQADWFHQQYAREQPVLSGLFDLNRYRNR